MSRILDRTAFGVFAFLFAVAAADVSVARAQAPAGPSIVPTTCGAGVLDECGMENIYHCAWKLVINLNSLPWGGGIAFQEVCEKSGTRPLYKDRLSAAPGSCSVPKPLGPPGSDDVEVPFEGNGTCDE